MRLYLLVSNDYPECATIIGIFDSVKNMLIAAGDDCKHGKNLWYDRDHGCIRSDYPTATNVKEYNVEVYELNKGVV